LKRSNLFSALLGEKQQGKTRSRSRVIIWISFLLAGILLYLALKDLDWSSFTITLSSANYAFLPFLMVWGSLSYFVRALRWRILLSAEGNISLVQTFWANMIGYLGNNILPARAGELGRAMAVGKLSNISSSFALASGLSERLMDVVALILLGSVSLSMSGIMEGTLQGALRALSVVAGIGVTVILVLPHLGGWSNRIITSLPLRNASLKEKLSGFWEKFLLGLQALLDMRRAAIFCLLTALIWLLDGLGTVITGAVLHIPITLPQAFVLMAGLGLSSAIPSTPGYVGVYQFVAVEVLRPFGIEPAAAFALILFIQFNNWIVVFGWGLIAMWIISRRFSTEKQLK
jgi:uncharacterized protein (TIRG00374 family)